MAGMLISEAEVGVKSDRLMIVIGAVWRKIGRRHAARRVGV